MYKDRIKCFEELEKKRDSIIISYITGDRPMFETKIHSEVYDFFVDHLDKIGVVKKISLFLYTRGGDTLAAWSLVNLIKQFCSDFEIIVPSKAQSAGTLMCLGSNRIIMTKQATLGPIDPSITTPLNPSIPGGPPEAKYPVSVEAINGYLDLSKELLALDKNFNLNSVLLKLSENVHPLVLGHVFRSKTQIKMLAKKLLASHISEEEKVEKIINFLSSESGSHDYTIHRREAKNELGLNIEKPDDELYKIIKNLYDNISDELELNVRFDPNTYLGSQNNVNYSFKRGLVESISGGSHYFVSEGTLSKNAINLPGGISQVQIQDNRKFEGWRYEKI